jgi:cytochrome c oxidase assembly protein subunit 15
MEAGTGRLARVRLPAVSVRAFRWLAWATLAALVAITLSGATVRLTGSGLGCENWPRCGDAFLPPKDFNALVEFGNRMLGVAVGLVSLACAVAAWRVPGLPRQLPWAATAIVGTVALQGVLGGITVLTELHPLIVMGHFLLALAAVALGVVLALGADRLVRESAAPMPPAWLSRLALALVPVALVVVVTGAFVTAAGPHSGGAEIERLGNLEDAVYVHVRATAAFGVGFLVLVAALFRRRERLWPESALAGCVLVLLVLQMAVGEIQWRNQLPWWLVLVHVALATAVWAGVVALAARLRPAARFRSDAPIRSRVRLRRRSAPVSARSANHPRAFPR